MPYFSAFRSMRMLLTWLTNSRLDALYAINQLSQVTKSRYTEHRADIVKMLNNTMRHIIEHPLCISFPPIDLQTSRIIRFSDAAFANNHDLTSQLGRLVMLADKINRINMISFKSYKSRRVIRSVLAAEVIAFSDFLRRSIYYSKPA